MSESGGADLLEYLGSAFLDMRAVSKLGFHSGRVHKSFADTGSCRSGGIIELGVTKKTSGFGVYVIPEGTEAYRKYLPLSRLLQPLAFPQLAKEYCQSGRSESHRNCLCTLQAKLAARPQRVQVLK